MDPDEAVAVDRASATQIAPGGLAGNNRLKAAGGLGRLDLAGRTERPQRDPGQGMAQGSRLLANLADSIAIVVGRRAAKRAQLGMVQVRQGRIDRLQRARTAPAAVGGHSRLENGLSDGEDRDWL